MPAFLSVNVNKYALLRNSRGHNTPDLIRAIETCLAAGAHGITVHPRRDQRHVRFDDVPRIGEWLAANHPGVELNVECADAEDLVELAIASGAAQCTLVPVRPGEVTSDHGWSFPSDVARLRPLVEQLHDAGIRASGFIDCDPETARAAADAGLDRVELYTGPYAWAWDTPDRDRETQRVWEAGAAAVEAGLELNAGHDLDRHNLAGLRDLPGLREVSIGHAQICRALDVGTTRSVGELLTALGW